MTDVPASTVVEFPKPKTKPLTLDGREPVTVGKPPKPLSDFVLTAAELAALDIPPRQYLLGNWIWKGSITLVYAKRGLGKTWFVLGIALALAKGETFAGFEVFEILSVFVIDGEMVLGDIKERTVSMAGGDIPENLSFLSSERLTTADQPPLAINEPETQRRIVELLESMDPRPDVVVFDNLSALTGVGFDENSATDAAPLMRFFVQLKHRGYTVIFVDHAGKDAAKGARGSSKKQDAIDTSIVLVEVDGDHITCVFKMKFDKTRGPVVIPREQVLTLEDQPDGSFGFSISEPAYQRFEKMLRAVWDGKGLRTRADVAKAINKDRSQTGKLVKDAIKEGLLTDVDKRLGVTDKGLNVIGELIPF